MLRRLSAALPCTRLLPRLSVLLLTLFSLTPLSSAPALGQAGHGNWSIQATYSGSAASTVSAVTPILYDCKVQGIAVGANQSVSLSTLNNSPVSTLTGGITSKLQADLHYKTAGPGNHTAQLAFSNAQVTFRLTWQP
jgi:hypothetical protein